MTIKNELAGDSLESAKCLTEVLRTLAKNADPVLWLLVFPLIEQAAELQNKISAINNALNNQEGK